MKFEKIRRYFLFILFKFKVKKTYSVHRRWNVSENTGYVPDWQILLALITSYGGTSSHWSTKLPLTVLRTLLHALRQLLGKSWSRPVFSLTFDLQCAGDVKSASRPEVVISNTYFDDDCFFLDVLLPQFLAKLRIINMFSPLIRVLFFLYFGSSLPL